MKNSLVTKHQVFTCPECQNDDKIMDALNVGDVVECDFCGIEYEILDITDESEYVLHLIEEEK